MWKKEHGKMFDRIRLYMCFFMLFGKDLKESLFFKKKPAQSVESDRPGDIFVAL